MHTDFRFQMPLDKEVDYEQIEIINSEYQGKYRGCYGGEGKIWIFKGDLSHLFLLLYLMIMASEHDVGHTGHWTLIDIRSYHECLRLLNIP